MRGKLRCCQFKDSNTEDAFRDLQKRKSLGLEKIVSLILALASCSIVALELRQGSIKHAILHFIIGGAYFASFYLASLHRDHYITYRRQYARGMRLLAVLAAAFQSCWSRHSAPNLMAQHTWLTILCASRMHIFWIAPIAYYLPLAEHILSTAISFVVYVLGNTALCQTPSLVNDNLEGFSIIARNIQGALGMEGLKHRYFQGQDSSLRHCISLITFTQLLVGAITSIWIGYYVEMSARSRFSQQAQQQQNQNQTTPSLSNLQFTQKEKVYYAMYDACGAWFSFIAVLPFLAVLSWTLAVVFVGLIL